MNNKGVVIPITTRLELNDLYQKMIAIEKMVSNFDKRIGYINKRLDRIEKVENLHERKR